MCVCCLWVCVCYNRLASLEKRLHRLSPHADFRVFLTAEIHPQLPASLLRQATRLVFEPPAGVKASLQRTRNAPHPPHARTSIDTTQIDR